MRTFKKYMQLIILTSAACCVSLLAHASESVLGSVFTDKMVYAPGEKVTIVFNLENATQKVFSPDWPPTFVYEVHDIQIGGGTLLYTEEPYIINNSTASFAVGTFDLKDAGGGDLSPSYYRLILFPAQPDTSAWGPLNRCDKGVLITVV